MVYALAILGLIGAFVWWRYTSVARGSRERNERILDLLTPLGEKLAAKQPVAAEEVRSLASRPQIRPMLHAVLKEYGRIDLFPGEYLDLESQASASLAHWLMHPNELQDAPAEMRLVEAVHRQIGGIDATFFVFRYRMPDGNWAAKEGWLLGLAGPFVEGAVPYSGASGAFSRASDKEGQIAPVALVDWYMDMAKSKGARW